MTQNSPRKYNIAVIGCGKMGSALIHGWVNADLINRAEILDPNEIDDSLTSHPDLFHVKLMESISFDDLDAVILAVKPQIMEGVCAELKKYVSLETAIISIAAGKKSTYFLENISLDSYVIRCMPNTPAAIGKGANVLYASNTLPAHHKDMAERLFNAVGHAHWVEDESLMDAVTALSGSGPAYVFYMMEAMTQAGINCGLSEELATALARQTVIGASSLAEVESDTPASILRQNVTSPNGTTQAAIDVLMNGELQDVMTRTLKAAQARSIELSD